MFNSIPFVLLHYARRHSIAVAIKTGVCVAFALMIVAPSRSSGQTIPEPTWVLVPCKDTLSAWQADLSLKDRIKGWYCPDPNARTSPIPPSSAGQSSSGGGFSMGLPTTDAQAKVAIMGWLIQGLMSSGSSADEQQQQALLQQKMAQEKMKAEMLHRDRAAQASEARSLWESQDSARSQQLAQMFGPPADNTNDMSSSLLQKQAALQLRVAAAPNRSDSDEKLRRNAGKGFDEAGNALAAVPAMPEPKDASDRGFVITKVKEFKTQVEKLDRELESTRQKREKAKLELEQARRETAKIDNQIQSAETPEKKAEADKLMQEALALMADAEKQLNTATQKVSDVEKQLNTAKQTLADAEKQLNATK